MMWKAQKIVKNPQNVKSVQTQYLYGLTGIFRRRKTKKLKKIKKSWKKLLTYGRGGAIIIKSPRYGSDKNLKKHSKSLSSLRTELW